MSMPPTVQDILDIIETIAPENLAESWDNVGLMIGSSSDRVNAILLALDPMPSLLEEAETLGANLIITHHPVIFHPLKSVRLEQPDGAFIRKAIQGNINVISCHTNLDAAAAGVNDSLAALIGLIDTQPLVIQDNRESMSGLGRIGNFPVPVTAADFIRRVNHACQPSWLLEAGSRPEKITRAAVCGGSCSDMAETSRRLGAQVFVTAEVKHNIARWAEQTGLWLIDAGHFATERHAMLSFARQLTDAGLVKKHGINIRVSERQVSPLRLIKKK